LQLLDQKRSKPAVNQQIRALQEFAGASKSIIVVISQIDRSFDPEAKRLPELSDVRLPNPVDLMRFSKTCFLHEGEVKLQTVS